LPGNHKRKRRPQVQKREKQDKHSTFQHDLKNPKQGSRNCTKKINLDDYLSTTIIRRKNHIKVQENKNNEILIAKKIEDKQRKECTNLKENKPPKDKELLTKLLLEDLYLSDEENDATWTLNAPENIELDFPPPPEEPKKPEHFKIPKQKSQNQEISTKSPLQQLDNRKVVKRSNPIMDPIIKQMEKKRKITTYEDLIITDEDIPDEILTFENEPEETIDHFPKENLEDKISEIRKQNETKVTLNIGGFKCVTLKQTLSKEPYSLLNHITTDIKGEIFIDRPAKHFNTILNYIRNDSTIQLTLLPNTKEDLLELKIEATYYHLPELRKKIEYKEKLIKK